MSNNERFRNELAARLNLPPEELKNVLTAFDIVSADYDINRRSMEIVPVGGMPEVVRVYLATKAVENLSRNTLQQYKWKLSDFFNVVIKPLDAITANDIRLYLYQFKQTRNVGDRYIDSVRVTLHGFFAWLVRNDYLVKNPCDKVERIRFSVKERVPLTTYELEQIRFNCKGFREKALIDFLFSTGCRVSECAEVRLTDINWHDRSVVIRHGKGNKERVVFFNAECELSLKNYLDSRSDDTDALFVSAYKPFAPLQKRGIETITRTIGERAGIIVFPHKLRHTFATCGINGGMPLSKLQTLMGHAKPETTMIYAHINRTDVQREHQRIYA